MRRRVSLDRDRFHFAQLMARLLIHHSERVLYLDETTFNSFTVLKRSWSTKEDPNMHAGA